jgi:AcrR family transcriptional regulator
MSARSTTAERLGPGDAFRDRIIQASIDLIQQQGLSALSMREVARRAGVSHKAPYHYLQDREAILAAIAEQGFRMLRDAVGAVANAGDGGAPQGKIVAVGKAYVRFALAHPAYFRVMFRPELVNPDRQPQVLEEGERACAICYEIVRDAVLAGLPAEPSVDALFLLSWSIGHGFACLALDGPLDRIMPGVDREAQLDDLLHAFSKLLEARAAQACAQPKRAAPPRKRDSASRSRA